MAQDIVLEGLGQTYLNVPAVTLPKSGGGTALFVEFTELANAGTQPPLPDGVADVGDSTSYAREDHVHPSDDTKVDKVANKGLSENDFTTALKEKLDNISEGAEVNVQPDWLEADSSSDAFIRNKPPNLVQDASYVHTDNNYTTTDKNKLSGISEGAEANVQANWNETNSSSDAFIQNKPSNLVSDADYVHTDNNYTNDEKSKLSGIAANAEVNVQADWNESDTASDAYIQNKPDLGNIVSFSVLEVSS